MKDDKILLGRIQDKIHKCENSYVPLRSDFLDPHQRSIVESQLSKGKYNCNIFFFGGYEDAERVCCVILPDYSTLEINHGLALLRVTKATDNRALTHRDYLGSLIGLGIRREKIGDILVSENGADIIVAEEIASFLLSNYHKVGRVEINGEILSINQVSSVEEKYDDKIDTMASLRLDNCVSCAFNISRSKASDAIKKGIVFINNKDCFKIDKEMKAGDKLVLKGKGKALLLTVGGKSRKDRIYVTFRLYK